MVHRNGSRRPGDLAPDALAATPPTPVVRKSEVQFPFPFVLAGARHGIGWHRPDSGQDHIDFVVVRRNALGTFKVLERYPLTDEGWAEAWKALVAFDPVEAEKALPALAQRAEADREFLARRELKANSLACLSEVVFLGGYVPGAELAAGKAYDVRFLEDRLAVLPCQGLQALAELPYSAVEAVDVGGPGLVKSGGGFVGGGFGVVGAAEGMAVAAILNGLTTRTKIKTVVRVEASSAELFSCTRELNPSRCVLSYLVRSARSGRHKPSEGNPLPARSNRVQDLWWRSCPSWPGCLKAAC